MQYVVELVTSCLQGINSLHKNQGKWHDVSHFCYKDLHGSPKKRKTLILTDCYVISELFKCALPKLAGQHWKFLC